MSKKRERKREMGNPACIFSSFLSDSSTFLLSSSSSFLSASNFLSRQFGSSFCCCAWTYDPEQSHRKKAKNRPTMMLGVDFIVASPQSKGIQTTSVTKIGESSLARSDGLLQAISSSNQLQRAVHDIERRAGPA